MADFDFVIQALERRRLSGGLRRLRRTNPLSAVVVELDGRRLVNFCSNDYLGLSRHPLVVERACSFVREMGAGSGASRLVCGNIAPYERIERRLAALKRTEDALLFSSGFQLNATLLPALADRRGLVVVDRLAHNSIIAGARLARCRFLRFRHNDLGHLDSLLRKNAGRYSRVVAMTESVFSMDGDRADLEEFARVCARHGAVSIVDEAHATGVLGPQGMGLAVGLPIDVVMGTFGKGCGSFGAYVACSAPLKEYLVNFCGGLIYTTALPPAVLGAVEAALEVVPAMDEERAFLAANAAYLRRRLGDMGFDCGAAASQIVPVIIGDDRQCVALSRGLEENGFLAVAIRPPTVESGRARIRLALSARHTREQIDALLDVLARLRP